ncbi:MAG: PAS domain-containing protein [Holosporales bacterium]|jgi:PAS domain-containing protein|nr:PAS domain-containing protein [Holosporales bacterium]
MNVQLENSTKKEIESTIAMFGNFSPPDLIENSVVYFWESHTDNHEDKKKVQATSDLIFRQFDISTCEKYEVHTGYLSRYNYMRKPMEELTIREIEKAIDDGKAQEREWLELCSPELPGFIPIEWEDCISKEKNLYFNECKELIINELKTNEDFYNAFCKTIKDYMEKRGTIKENGELYILEEISWILSLPLMHLNKPVYLIHIGNDNAAIKGIFHTFPNLSKAVKWLSPRFRNVVFKNTADFLMYYSVNNYAGCSYALENKSLINPISTFKKSYGSTKEELKKEIENKHSENNMLRSIIGGLPGHVYWLNRDNIYLGCNDLQAKDFGLNSKDEIIGKTNYDLLKVRSEADELNRINIKVMETGEIYEGEEIASFNRSKYEGNFLTNKTPLYDLHGKVIGLLGISMDITDRRKAELLTEQKKVQQENIDLQNKIRGIFEKFVKNINPTLTKLHTISMNNKNLTEDEKITIASEAIGIKSIINELLLALQENKLDRFTS